ncbi:MAG TPA: hypothetical protein VEG38_21965, partial [Acidimicrobiia bacterium]|nr:hypothetical protein [Acidimicrobiia bacterium]
MPTITLRPTALLPEAGDAVGGWNDHNSVRPPASHTYVADDSDATWYFASTFQWGHIALEMGTFSFPANSQIRSVTPRIKYKTGWSSNGSSWNGFGIRLYGVEALSSLSQTADAIWTVNGTTHTTKPGGGAWTQADIDNIQWIGKIPAYHSTATGQIYEAYILVEYNLNPGVTNIKAEATSLPTTLTNTAQPTITWTYTDPEADAQERFIVKVFGPYTST